MRSPILFEVVSPPKGLSTEKTEAKIMLISDSIKRMKKIDKINIPEVVDENFTGKPYYRNIDNREFGFMLREKCKKDIILNKVVVHFPSNIDLRSWIDDSINQFRINEFIFVGGSYNFNYPGPNVCEANKIGHDMGIRFGNIAIPSREGEINRLIQKTELGSSFFTSQILLSVDKAIELLKEYQDYCDNQNINPAMVYLSFSPVSNHNDIEFIRWLGAEFSSKTESFLNNSKNLSDDSINIIIELINNFIVEKEKLGIEVPFGLNIEKVLFHNLELSERLINKIYDMGL